MAISEDLRARILRYHHVEKWRAGTIARQLGVHHTTVRRVLVRAGVPEALRATRPSMADPYLPFVLETLKRFPTLTASRVYQMVRERGYPGGPDHFRHLVALHRPRRAAEAYLRLRTLPGEQAQVDWAHFSKIDVGQAGGRPVQRPLMAFVMVLSWSRWMFLRFYTDQRLANFLRGHRAAFESWGGIPKTVLYDNPKIVVLERQGDAIRFHPGLLDFAAHYRYEPRPVAVARGNEKGRVERSISYVRTSFFAARTWRDLDDLNAQAAHWCEHHAGARPCPEERTCSVRERFERERPALLALPDNPFPTEECVEVKVGKTPYVRFDCNDYSIPHTHVRRTLVVRATLKQVRVLDGTEVLACHPRSFDKRQQIEQPEHIQALVQYKRAARTHRHLDRLSRAAPASTALLERAAARGTVLRTLTRTLEQLLDQYGAAELQAACTEALERDVPHPNAVRQSLERRRCERQQPPALPVPLPDDPRLRELAVRPHPLEHYDISDDRDEH